MALLTPDLGFIVWHAIIFLVTLLVLGRYAWKPILQAIQAREKAYEDAVHTMQQAEAEVQALDTQKEHILASAHTQSDRIVEDALKRKEAILQAAEEEALQEKKKILDNALHTIALEKEAAQSDIKKHTVALVLHTTEKLISHALLTDPHPQKLIQQMMQDVENNPQPD